MAGYLHIPGSAVVGYPLRIILLKSKSTFLCLATESKSARIGCIWHISRLIFEKFAHHMHVRVVDFAVLHRTETHIPIGFVAGGKDN